MKRDVEELPKAQRVGGPPGNCPLGIEPFEVAQEQHPEVPARRQARLADAVSVELRALLLGERVEARLVEQAVQTLVERMAGAPRQLRVGHPTSTAAAPVGGVYPSPWNECRVRDRSCRSLRGRFTTACWGRAPASPATGGSRGDVPDPARQPRYQWREELFGRSRRSSCAPRSGSGSAKRSGREPVSCRFRRGGRAARPAEKRRWLDEPTSVLQRGDRLVVRELSRARPVAGSRACDGLRRLEVR